MSGRKMKTEFLKRRADSSSDESDDIIPPTPAAKSTPLTSSTRQRKQSSSSDSSSNRTPFQTSRASSVALKSSVHDDSSSEDDGGNQNATPRLWQTKVKKEPKSSSSEEDMFQTSLQDSSHQMNRSTHAMSSSDSEDSAPEKTAVQTHHNQDTDSSEDSDNDHVAKQRASSTLATVTKVEKPSTTESSDESDKEEDTSASKNVLAFSNVSGDSSSEDDGVNSNQVQKEAETSSDESEGEQDKKVGMSKAHSAAQDTSSDESDGEEGKFITQGLSKDTSSDESDDEVVEPKPVFRENDHSDESDNETMDQKPVVRGNVDDSDESDSDHPQLNQMSVEGKSYADSSSEDESDNSTKPSIPSQNQASKSNIELSEDESSDEEPSSKPPPSTSEGNHTHEQSSEESSEDEENEKHVKQPVKSTPTLIQNRVTTDRSSSEDSTDASASENEGPLKLSQQDHTTQARSSETRETHVSKFNPKSQSKITDYVTHQSSDFSPRNQQQHAVLPSGKLGKALLKETFKERDPFRMENAVLTVEDIRSDDEIWLFQCPSSMDISALKKQSINLASDCDIQLEHGPTFKRFSITPEHNSNSSINCVLPHQNGNGFQISSLPIRGKVVIQEHVHVPKLRLPEKSLKGPVPFPSGLKVRHPLLGVGFEEHIAQAQKALRASEHYERKKSKKRKHGLRDGYPAEANGEDRNFSHSLNEIVPSTLQSKEKKDKKHKHKTAHENQSNGIVEEGSSKKKRKISSEVQNLNNERLDSQSVDGSFLNDTYRKKSKKSKDVSNSDGEKHNQDMKMKGHGSLIKSEPCDTSDDNLSRKKNKKSKKGDPTMDIDLGQTPSLSKIPLYSDQTPVSLDNSSLKKKRRKSKQDNVLLNPSEIKQEKCSVNGTSEPYSNESSSSKKNKRKHSEDYYSDISQTPSKKRKKHSV